MGLIVMQLLLAAGGGGQKQQTAFVRWRGLDHTTIYRVPGRS
jgi:hypothetical protein